MPDIFRYRNRPTDEAEYADWLLGREAERADRPHWLEVDAGPTESGLPDQVPPQRTVTAKKGDNISRIVGTSDPSAIGAFARANGLRPGESTIYAGRTYVIPDDGEGTADDRRGGLLMIGRDNSRLARIQAERERAQAARAAQQREVELALDQSRYMPRYGDRPFSQATPTPTPPVPSKPDLATRFSDAADAALARLPPQWSNDPRARAIASFLAREAGTDIGYGTGALKVARDTVKGGLFAARLVNPLSAGTYEGNAAGQDVLRAIGAVKDYGASRLGDVKLVHQDASEAWRAFREAHDPSATPPGATLGQEVQRNFRIGKNDGEMSAEVGSLFIGGPLTKAVGRVGTLSKASTAADFAAQGWRAGTIPRLLKPYDGIGHHNIRRAWARKYNIDPDIVNSRLFVVDGEGMNFGDFQRRHYGLDDDFHGGSTGGGWSGRETGMRRYDLPERLWYGTPPLMKASIGTGAAIGIASAEQSRKR